MQHFLMQKWREAAWREPWPLAYPLSSYHFIVDVGMWCPKRLRVLVVKLHVV